MAARHFLPEWYQQQAILLTWPHSHSDWLPWLPQADATYAALVQAISHYQPCIIIVYDDAHERYVREQLLDTSTRAGQVRFIHCPTNDTWVRDYGPLSVMENNHLLLMDFVFNGWGGKYDATVDDAVTRNLHGQQLFSSTPLVRTDLILEGGSVETDGHDTILTTSQCLLHPGRNHITREQLEQALYEHLGAERVLWLDHGELQGDDTDAHIDTLARFCSADTIAYVSCDQQDDVHYPSLQAMAEQLSRFSDYRGQAYNLVPLPLPDTVTNEHGQRLPATYANFLMLNEAVIVPVYQVPQDEAALRQLESCFPGKTIVPVTATTLLLQYGSIHCATMQLPHGMNT